MARTIRVSHTGLSWDKIGEPTEMIHDKCGARVFINKQFNSCFCTGCSKWLTHGITEDRPDNALVLLNITNRNNMPQ